MPHPELSRGRALAYLVLVLALLALGGRFLLRAGEGEGARVRPHGTELRVENAPRRTLLVHVVGAVRRPGLYRLREGDRVHDAMRRAGGAKRKAALELVNLASPVADGQQVLVPLRGSQPMAAGGAGEAAAGGRVHLNSATLEQLDALPGVGPVTAQNILDYRQEHGAFTSVEELDAVPGIGPARLEQLKPLVDL